MLGVEIEPLQEESVVESQISVKESTDPKFEVDYIDTRSEDTSMVMTLGKMTTVLAVSSLFAF